MRALPNRRPPWRLALSVAAALFVLAAGGGIGVYFFAKRPLPPSGGWYSFSRFELSVPLFSRATPPGGRTNPVAANTISRKSAAPSASAAMVMKFYGIETDPGRLNVFLRDHEGFDENNDLRWEGPALLAPDRVRHAYEDLPSYFLIDSNIYRGNPVIVRLHLASGWTHFVVIMGKQGFDYLIRDPSSAGLRKGVYPLRELGSKIEALRFYEHRPAAG